MQCRFPSVSLLSLCHQMITQRHPKESLGVMKGQLKIAIFQPTHASLKAAQSSLVGRHKGDERGYPEIEPGTPSFVRGSILKKKVGSKSTHSAGYRATKFLPPWCKQAQNIAFQAQRAPLGGPNWCYVGRHGFMCTSIVTE